MTGRVVYVGGTFDLLHPGHIRLLRAARHYAQGGGVWVALNQDAFILRYKGHPPVQTLEERHEVVSAVKYVDYVIVNTGDEDSRPSIAVARPDLIVVGDDWLPRERYLEQLGVTEQWLAGLHADVVFVDRSTSHASSLLRQKGGLDTPRSGV